MRVIEYEGWKVTGHHCTVGYFKHHPDALKAAEGKGEWGSNGSVKFVEESVVIYDSFEEYNHQIEKMKVEGILKALKPEEIDLLKRHFGATDEDVAVKSQTGEFKVHPRPPKTKSLADVEFE